MVATAGTILFLILACGSCRLANTSSTSTDFGVRVDDNVMLPRLRLGILALKETARQTPNYNVWDADSCRQVPKKFNKCSQSRRPFNCRSRKRSNFPKKCGALAAQRERRTKTCSDKLPFSDGWISLAWCTSPR
jgi:hypothetical protein